jgi:hypothetical protein
MTLLIEVKTFTGTTVATDSRTVANSVRLAMAELSARRKCFELIHECAHSVLAENDSGMSAFFRVPELLMQSDDLWDWRRAAGLTGRASSPDVDFAALADLVLVYDLPKRRADGLPPVPGPVPADGTECDSSGPSAEIAPDAAQFLRGVARSIIDLSKKMVRKTGRQLAAMRLWLARLLAVPVRNPDQPAFALIVLAVCRHYGRRSEPDHSAVLLTCRHLTSWGAGLRA